MIELKIDTKYNIDFTTRFKKQFKNSLKQGKDVLKLIYVIEKLANKERLGFKYRDHALIKDKNYTNCRECHIEPDWLLIYEYQEDKLVLLLVGTGSHSDLF